jgi:mannose-1-phosphate guanylyltransferase
MSAKKSPAIAVILCGGEGERFWPLTDSTRPKYALKLHASKSLLHGTYARLRGLFPPDHIYVMTIREHASLIKKLIPQLLPSHLLTEPSRRNTGAAVSFASFVLAKRYGAKAILSFFPADADIKQKPVFLKAIKSCIHSTARSEKIMVLGIKPSFPSTGYGYIESGAPIQNSFKGNYHVKTFHEKPSLKKAKRYCRSKRFLWNAGIFTWRIDTFFKELKRARPSFFNHFKKSFSKNLSLNHQKQLYRSLPNISIDRLLIEGCKNLGVVHGTFGWSDIGSWDALNSLGKKNNVLHAQGVFEDINNCVIISDKKNKVVVSGLRDIAIVQRGSHLLVCGLHKSQDVARLKKLLKKDSPR